MPSHIHISSALPPTPLTALIDPTQIQQVIMNLCTNARQAIHTSPGLLSISLDPITLPPTSRARYLQKCNNIKKSPTRSVRPIMCL